MPLVTIDSLPPTDASRVPEMIASIRHFGARAMNCSEDNIWVIFRPIPSGYYVQGHAPAIFPQEKSHPPIVIIRAHVGRSREVKSAFVAAVAKAIGEGLSIPAENVWIHYLETQLEDVWFNGHWANGSLI